MFFQQISSIFSHLSHFEREDERKMFAFVRGEKRGKVQRGDNRKTRHTIHFHCVLQAMSVEISDLVDAITHLPPHRVAHWHGVAQLENNGRSPPSGCSLYPVPV